jgi:starvation-inducible outer membrane lipoprotein
MKRIIFKTVLLLTTSLLLTSCMTMQPLPLKGAYLDKPYEVVSDKKFEQVWTNIIDLFCNERFINKVN